MNQRGEYGVRGHSAAYRRCMYVSDVQVAKVFATRGDFEQGLKQLDTDFSALINEALSSMGGDPRVFTRAFAQQAITDPTLMAEMQKSIMAIEKSAFYPYYKHALMPLYNEWNEYIKDPVGVVDALVQAAFGGPFGNIGPSPVHEALKRWQARLDAARTDMNTELKRLGKEPLRSPGSVPLPETLFEKGERAVEKAGAGLEDIGKVLKWVLIGVAAVGGVVVVSTLASKIKKDKEPEPRYMERFREPRARKAPSSKAIDVKETSRALPASSV